MDRVTFPIRVFKQLGVDTVVCEYYYIGILQGPKDQDNEVITNYIRDSDKCGRRPQF